MSAILQFRWTHRSEHYEFRAEAQTPRSSIESVDTELLAIRQWIDAQRLSPTEFTLQAQRIAETIKEEALTISHGKVHADGGTRFQPIRTEVRLTLPKDVALRFQIAFATS